MNLHSSSRPLAFPWTLTSGWSLASTFAIYFGDPGRGTERTAFISGIQFMKDQLLEDFVFDLSIGYYKDLSYKECDANDRQIISAENLSDLRFHARNIFTLEDDKRPANYWLLPYGQTGPAANFVLDLGCPMTIMGIRVKNTRNAQFKTFGTKKFRLFGSTEIDRVDPGKDSPWKFILEKSLDDPRNQNPIPTLELMLDDLVTVQYVKFEVHEIWRKGGGLQHFSVIQPDGATPGFYKMISKSLKAFNSITIYISL